MLIYRLMLTLAAIFFYASVFAQCTTPFKVLHYTETTGYDHNTRSVSLSMFQFMGSQAGFSVTSDDDGTIFNSLDSLEQFAVIVFANTSGANGLDSLQRANMESYMQGGGSFLGIHAAGDTYRHSTANGNSTGNWDWYAETLTGASVQTSPNHTASSHVDTLSRDGVFHPVTETIPDPWIKQEEYYYWENGFLDTTFNPILFVDQTGNDSYDLPRMMAQIKELPSGGRSFYTALGHAPMNYTSDTIFYQLLLDALMWTAEPNLSSSLDYSLQIVQPQCTNNGFIAVLPADTSSTFTYGWSTGSSASVVAGLGQGTYTVTISDSSGCSSTDTISLFSVSGPVLSFSITDSIDCFGGSNGALTLSASGGTPPYQIVWANGDTSVTRSNLPSGTYTALVTDSLGCTVLDSLFLPEPPQLIVDLVISDSISCFGLSDGAATAVASGGTGNYAYFWPNGDTTATRSFLPTGSYFATVTDDNGCVGSDNLTIPQPDSLQALLTIPTPVQCVGTSTGSAMVSGTGGTAPYSYFWANGDTSAFRSALPAGTYTVTITDANGCSVTDSVILTDPPALIAGGMITDSISCFGAGDGTLMGVGSGGFGPYSYTWGNGDTSQSRSGLSAGGYFLTITDANGCTESVTLTLPQPTQVAATGQVTDSVSCFGASDGGVLAIGSGGSGGYQYAWANGDTSAQRIGLPAGAYFVTITDQNGCSAGKTITLTEPTPLAIQLSISSPVSCQGGSDGEITVSGQGGTGAYQVTWGNGDSSFVRTNLPPGIYFATLSDENGCTVSDSVQLQPGDAVIPQLTILQELTCNEDADASIQASATGGNAPYSFLWENGDTSMVRTGLSGGVYTVTITDSAGCFSVDSILVNTPSSLVPVILTTQPLSCAGSSDASLERTAAGGESPYAYSWEDGSTQAIRQNLGPGMYILTVTDNRGCIRSDSLTVSDPDSIQIILSATPDSSCTDEGNGSISVQQSGAQGGLIIRLLNDSGTEVASDSVAPVQFAGLSQGWYTVRLTDDNQCETMDSVEVADNCFIGHNIVEFPGLQDFWVYQGQDGGLMASLEFLTHQTVKVQLQNSMGQILSTQEARGSRMLVRFPTESLAEGIYFVSVEKDGRKSTRTIILR